MITNIWTAPLFDPFPGITGRHAQTLIGNVLRSGRGITFNRRRIHTPDGDFIDLDFADVDGATWEDLGPKAPIALLLHGLEGSARRGYASESYRQLAARGIRPVGMNFRSCSGEVNRTARFYHAGATDDVITVYRQLDEWFSGVPKGIIGVSLGANMLLKLLGEWGDEAPESLRAGAAISPPFNLVAGSRRLLEPPGLWYSLRFLPTLKRKVRDKEPLLTGLIDVDRVLQARNLREFDEFGTAPLHGFRDADDYYQRTSSGQFLPGIRRPVLIIRAQDDPLMDPDEIPFEVVARNPHLLGFFPPQGGHVGFTSRGDASTLYFWSENQAARFLAHHLGAGGGDAFSLRGKVAGPSGLR